MDETERSPADGDTRALREATLRRIRREIALTRAGLVAERAARAFWPAWTAALALGAAIALGAVDALPLVAAQVLVGAGGALALGLLLRGALRFRLPSRGEAVARLDATLKGRPIAALADRPAIAPEDSGTAAVWAAHVARMAARAAAARAPRPDLRLARADRFALRYVALTAAVVALLFGAAGRIGEVSGLAPGAAGAVAAGPVWEGWINPPAHTGKPALYLNDLAADAIDLPQGSLVTLRFYGEPGAFGLEETVSGTPAAVDATGGARFPVERDGRIAITGPGAREWTVALLPDRAPEIRATGPMTREEEGRLALPFEATDDYGVVSGQARIMLDLAAVDRRFGLAVAPEPRRDVVIDLPMPFAGDRTVVAETLMDDLSKHPFANLPVSVHLSAEDAVGQIGLAVPVSGELPGRRFFDPLAAAIIEARRDLLWSVENARRTAQVLRAVTHRPEGFVRNERAFLRLRVAMRRLEAATAPVLDPAVRDEIAEELWEIALLVEQGDLASALERLRRAQDRLEQAMRDGASQSEVQELMDELREALDNYMRQLAEEAERDPEGRFSEQQQDMQMSGTQLQELLDRLQQLMEEGRMAEAQELMEMLRQLMENMRVTQGEGQGEGQGQGNRAMRDLAETLRDQQGLSDDSFRALQDGFNRGQQQGRDPGEGQQGAQGEGQGQRQGQGLEQGDGRNPGGGSLADRQRALRDRLNALGRGELPGEGSPQGEAGRQALDRAGRAMTEAERRLREGDLPGALDRQAEALDALREGMQNLGEALAEEQRRENGGQPGQQFGSADPRGQRDPLGRSFGQMGRIGTDENMLQGEDVYRRAEDLLRELRRRLSDQGRGEEERDYLRRLLDRF
jgi:uncharacterized protein (TIGR02302 family)